MNSRHQKLLIDWIFYSLFALLLLPAIWYSLNTPFALIDDYGDWLTINEFASLSAVSDWFRKLFLYYGHGRFHPFFSIYHAMTWVVLGPRPLLHHLVRLLVKFAVVYFSLKMFLYFTKDKLRTFNAGVFAFLSIYLFFPNNPEARLSPLELEGVFFLSATIFFLCKLLMIKDGDISRLSIFNYIGLLLSFVFLCFAKEPFIVLALVCLSFTIILNLRAKAFFRLLPFVAVFIFDYCKISAAFKGGGYGVSHVDFNSMVSNFFCYAKHLSLINTSVIFTVMFVLPVLYYMCKKTIDIRKQLRTKPVILEQCPYSLMHFRDRLTGMLLYDKEFTFYVFLLLNFLAFYAIALTFWTQEIRYFYPLVYILALLIGISIVQSLQLWKHSKKFTLVVIISSLYFVSVNYYHFLYQFACQYVARNTERRMLTEVTGLLEQNRKVCIVVDSEYEDKVVTYFNQYLPKYRRTDYRIASVQKHDIFTLFNGDVFFNGDVYYVTKDAVFHSDDATIPGHMVLEKKFIDDPNLLLLKVANKISSAALLGKTPPLLWCDAGARAIGSQSWYIYKINFNSENGRNRAILYESNQLCEILGANPYGEHAIELPNKTLAKDHVFLVKLKYHTAGNAIPHVIVIQTPYRSDNIPLDERIQLSTTSRTTDLLFSPRVDTPSPLFLLRNWSADGLFAVENIEVFEIGIEPNDISSKQK